MENSDLLKNHLEVHIDSLYLNYRKMLLHINRENTEMMDSILESVKMDIDGLCSVVGKDFSKLESFVNERVKPK